MFGTGEAKEPDPFSSPPKPRAGVVMYTEVFEYLRAECSWITDEIMLRAPVIGKEIPNFETAGYHLQNCRFFLGAAARVFNFGTTPYTATRRQREMGNSTFIADTADQAPQRSYSLPDGALEWVDTVTRLIDSLRLTIETYEDGCALINEKARRYVENAALEAELARSWVGLEAYPLLREHAKA